MTERDLIYWVQGFFEIIEFGDQEIKALTAEQVKTVQRHIDLVRETTPNSVLCIALEPILKMSESAPMYSFEALKAIVASYFQHVIDPEDEEGLESIEIDKLNETHFPKGLFDDVEKSPIYRC